MALAWTSKHACTTPGCNTGELQEHYTEENALHLINREMLYFIVKLLLTKFAQTFSLQGKRYCLSPPLVYLRCQML